MPYFQIIAEVENKDYVYAITARSHRAALKGLVNRGYFLEWKRFGPKSKSELMCEISDLQNPFPVLKDDRHTRRMAVLVGHRLAILEVQEIQKKHLANL